MRTLTLLLSSATLLLTAACVDTGSSGHNLRDRDQCKIEGSQIGQVGAWVAIGSHVVTFTSWTPKADSPGEYVGFTLSDAAAGYSYVVKAGGQRHEASGLSWSHPNGNSGPNVPGISHVDFCDNDPPPHDEPCEPEDDDGGGDGELPEIP